MKHTVYALTDPAGTYRFIGVTASPLQARLNNHVSEAKFRSNPEHKLPLNVKMEWILWLLKQGRRPGIIALASSNSRERAQVIASKFIREHDADVLNGYKVVRAGRPVGYVESAATIEKKRLSRRARPAPKETDEGYYGDCIKARRLLGFPEPEMGSFNSRANYNYAARMKRAGKPYRVREVIAKFR